MVKALRNKEKRRIIPAPGARANLIRGCARAGSAQRGAALAALEAAAALVGAQEGGVRVGLGRVQRAQRPFVGIQRPRIPPFNGGRYGVVRGDVKKGSEHDSIVHKGIIKME